MSIPRTRSRLFVALPLPDGVRTRLAGYLARCAELAPDQRWAPPDNLHLTLYFLGWVEPAATAGVAAELDSVRRRGFRLQVGGLGRFGSTARPRLLWIGVTAGREPLADLAAAVGAACRRGGVVGDERPYSPHLTLCRLRPGTRLPALPEPEALPAWDAGFFTLFQSRPGPRGPVYVPLREYPLGAPQGGAGDPK